MLPIPPEIWAVTPKDVRWWAAAMPVGNDDYTDFFDENDTEETD